MWTVNIDGCITPRIMKVSGNVVCLLSYVCDLDMIIRCVAYNVSMVIGLYWSSTISIYSKLNDCGEFCINRSLSHLIYWFIAMILLDYFYGQGPFTCRLYILRAKIALLNECDLLAQLVVYCRHCRGFLSLFHTECFPNWTF